MKKCILIAVLAIMILCMTGCNRQVFDTTWKFDRAIISMPDGSIIDGEVQSWRDYDGDQIQVKVNDATYLVHSNNIVLIAE